MGEFTKPFSAQAKKSGEVWLLMCQLPTNQFCASEMLPHLIYFDKLPQHAFASQIIVSYSRKAQPYAVQPPDQNFPDWKLIHRFLITNKYESMREFLYLLTTRELHILKSRCSFAWLFGSDVPPLWEVMCTVQYRGSHPSSPLLTLSLS